MRSSYQKDWGGLEPILKKHGYSNPTITPYNCGEDGNYITILVPPKGVGKTIFSYASGKDKEGYYVDLNKFEAELAEQTWAGELLADIIKLKTK